MKIKLKKSQTNPYLKNFRNVQTSYCLLICKITQKNQIEQIIRKKSEEDM